MPKSGLTTTQEGYGWTHQQARRILVRDLRDGDPCCRCDMPMYRWQAELPPTHRHGLDAGHSGNDKALGLPPDHLEHRRCNRRAGAIAGNRRRAQRSSPPSQRAATVRLSRPLPKW